MSEVKELTNTADALNKIPLDWTVVTVADVSKVGSSKRILQSEYVQGGVLFFRSKEAIRRSKKMPIESPLYISRARFEEIKDRFGAPKKNEILVTAVGTIGVIYLIEDIEFYFKDGNLLWIKDINQNVNSSYLAKYLASDIFQNAIKEISGGSSQSALTIEKLSQLEFNLPPLPEQQKIAAILSSVDEVIEKTQAQIDKLKDLKTGMMQVLLTKGIGHTEFKDSPVGSMPSEWEVVNLKSVVERIFDCEHKTAPYVDSSQYLVVRTSNVRGGEIIHEGMKFTTEEGFTEWTKRAIPSVEDVLFTREAPAGESCLVPEGIKVCLGQRMVLLRPDKTRVTSDYFSLFLASEIAGKSIYELSIGTTVARINIEDINKIPCVIPPVAEQKAIFKVVQAIQESISSKQLKLKSLKDIKKGLMQDLLTGKVRVTLN